MTPTTCDLEMPDGRRLSGDCSPIPLPPLFYQGVLYTLKVGGILSSFDIETGDFVKQARIQGALGDYYASPVAGDGKIYTVSEEGKVAVIHAGAEWEQIALNTIDDGSKSTPAIVDGRIYLRTYSALYCLENHG
jgi:outer membrane protein assembly factor BamB